MLSPSDKVKGARILVTGGAGFIGSHVVEKLLPLGPEQVTIVDNLLRGNLENMESFLRDPRVKFIQDDIRNSGLMQALLRESDYCFHMAALRITRCAADPEEAFQVMVRATFELVEAAHKAQLKKLIYSSSASVYGLAPHFPTPETDPPYDNKTLYGAAKLFGEGLLRSYHDMYGLPYAALRYFNVYGPRMDLEGKYTEVLVRWLDCIHAGEAPVIFGDGSTSMDFIYVEDVAEANLRALLSDANDEVFNVGHQRETSLKELLDALLKLHGAKLTPRTEPERKVNPVGRRLADIRLARERLGWKPTVSLEEGLFRLANWYRVRKGMAPLSRPS